jgi:hypothetical protein
MTAALATDTGLCIELESEVRRQVWRVQDDLDEGCVWRETMPV